MAMQDKQGNWHHSASRARLHDELADQKKSSAATPTKKDSSDKGPGSMMHPAPTKTPIEEHVAEHGPAHSIMYHHDADGDGMHHVSSFHGDAPSPYGKMAGGQNDGAGEHTGEGGGESAAGESHMMDHPGAHHSKHRTHHEAMRHMSKAMGAHEEDEETPDSHEEPDGDESGASGGIPGLS